MARDPVGVSILNGAFSRLISHYTRLAQPISSVSLVFGFLFDAITLKRVDLFWENFWVIVHLVVVAVCIVLISRGARHSEELADNGDEAGGDPVSRPSKFTFWLSNLMQFFFGGLLSTYMVFYFRGGSIWVSWPFLLLLTVAFIANERLKSAHARLGFQVSLFFLSLFCFAIFIMPVVLHTMGRFVFLLSGATSLVLLWLFLGILRTAAKETFFRERRSIAASIAIIFIAVNVLYFLNFIPPLPLSLQDASAHHSIVKTDDGNYVVESERQGWLRYFRPASEVHLAPGDPLYVYSAVFSPTSLNTAIVHEWQTYDNRRGWITANRITLPVRGGRDGGYRTYSMKTDVHPGAWRVNIKTADGAVLGRLRFNVVQVSSAALSLKTELKN